MVPYFVAKGEWPLREAYLTMDGSKTFLLVGGWSLWRIVLSLVPLVRWLLACSGFTDLWCHWRWHFYWFSINLLTHSILTSQMVGVVPYNASSQGALSSSKMYARVVVKCILCFHRISWCPNNSVINQFKVIKKICFYKIKHYSFYFKIYIIHTI